jgi:hypothetical protein
MRSILRSASSAASMLLAVTLILAATTAWAEEDSLAQDSQNPIANLISVPLQNNFNFGVGLEDDLQYVLNIQPVIPISLSGKLLLINRLILPVMYQPELAPGVGQEWGLGNLTYQAYLSPKSEGSSITWGVGPVLMFPTNTDDIFGSDKWAIGPGAVLVWLKNRWVIGGVINNIWDYAGPSSATDVNFMTAQYFVNYNFPAGFYFTSAPIITANWEADSGDRLTLPIGGGFGKVFRFGKLPVNMSLQGYRNVVHPDNGAEWQMRFQAQFLFPK